MYCTKCNSEEQGTERMLNSCFGGKVLNIVTESYLAVPMGILQGFKHGQKRSSASYLIKTKVIQGQSGWGCVCVCVCVCE